MVELVLLDLLRQVVSRSMFIHVWDSILVLSQMCVYIQKASFKSLRLLGNYTSRVYGEQLELCHKATEISACRSVFMEVIKCVHYSA